MMFLTLIKIRGVFLAALGAEQKSISQIKTFYIQPFWSQCSWKKYLIPSALGLFHAVNSQTLV